MSGNRIRTLLRSDIARLVFVAVLGAAIVLSFQALTKGSNGAANHTSAQVIPSQVAPGAPAAGRPPTGRAPGVRAPAAQPGAGASPAAPASSAPAPVSVSSLGRVPVGGPGLAVVVDEPTGALAQQNRLIIQGATLAVEQLNARGGVGHRAVRIVPEHLDGLTPAAVQSRLRAAGPGAVLVLPCDTNSQFSLAAGAAPYKTLMLAPCDADPAVAQRIATYWPVGAAGNAEAAGLAGYLRLVGYGSVFVINTPGFSYATVLTRFFRAAVQAQSIHVVGDATVSLGMGDAETKRLAAAIAAFRPLPAALFSALPPPYVNRLATALARAGVRVNLIGTSTMDTPLTLKSGTGALEDATFPSYGFVRQLPAGNRFAAAYRKRFGVAVGAFPGLGFETIGVLEDAIAKARSTEPAAIQQALLGGISHAGAALFDRSYRGGPDHNPVAPVSVEKIAAGAFLPLLTKMPPTSPKA